MKEQKFFRCKHCGNFTGIINDAGVPMICCGEPMEELIANTVDASKEKHLPDVKVDGETVTVQIGSTLHPMTTEHHIEFVYLETKNGGQRKNLTIDSDPIATFKVVDDTLLNVFAYCNLHGLWKTEIK